MSVIAIDINNFCLGYELYHYNDGTVEKIHCNTFEDIASFVPEYCYNHNVKKVMIQGNPVEGHELATMIYRNKSANYAENELEIEVI